MTLKSGRPSRSRDAAGITRNGLRVDPAKQRDWQRRGAQRYAAKQAGRVGAERPTATMRKPCTIDDCTRLARRRGLCDLHYSRLRAHGDANYRPPTTADRFWRKVRKDDEPTGGCWIWTGAISGGGGYGQFYRGAGKYTVAHRYAYEQLVGPIPLGLVLDHTCGVRVCVNPDHLEVVTPGENTRRGNAPSIVTSRTGRCARGHPMADAYVVAGRRQCRTCHVARQRKHMSKYGNWGRPTRALVRARSGGTCEICGEARAAHMHHRQSRRHRDHRVVNALHLCVACHRRAHNEPKASYRLGWLVRSTVDPATVPAVVHDTPQFLALDGTYQEAA